MANKITINAVATNTDKQIEYLHPTTNVWQTSNVLTNVLAGTYTSISVRLKNSNPAITKLYTGNIVVTDSTDPNTAKTYSGASYSSATYQ